MDDGGQGGFTSRGGNRVWWDATGDGPPLLLVMGHAWDSRMWWRVVPALAAQHRVIRFDNRGIGRTVWDGRPFGIEDLAADAFAVLDAASVESAHVYGISMGGLVAQEMALSRPDRVRSLVLGGTAAFSATATAGTRGSWVQARLPIWWVAKAFPSALYGPDADPDAVREDIRLMREANMPVAGRTAQIKAVSAYRSLERLGGITAPTLILHGERDKAIAVDKARQLHEGVALSELIILPRAGHDYLVDRDTRATTAVLDFLQRH